MADWQRKRNRPKEERAGFHNMFKTRLLSGIVLVAAALVLIITGGDVLLFSTLLISYIGMFELFRIFHVEKELPGIVGYLAATGISL